MNSLVKALALTVRSEIYPILKQFEIEYVNDAYSLLLEQAFDSIQERFNKIQRDARRVSSEFVESVENQNKLRFYQSVENAIGVNVQSIIQNEGLDDILRSSVRENVNLIKSISDEYLKKVETIVWTNTTQGSTAGSMIDQIGKLNGQNLKRAKLIARDQTAKINASLTQQRQQNLGVEEYIWRTSQDDRVRESHKRNNGKTFRWDTPPPETGHPGTDIQCRCIAQPIIKL